MLAWQPSERMSMAEVRAYSAYLDAPLALDRLRGRPLTLTLALALALAQALSRCVRTHGSMWRRRRRRRRRLRS